MGTLEQIIAVLKSTPLVVRALISDLPEELIHLNEGGNSWSPFDIVGHYIHGEKTDWIPRLYIILEHGESKPFEPFDRFAQFGESHGKSLNELLDTFEELRNQNVENLELLRLTDEQLILKGTHPEFRSVTTMQLLTTWAVHDLSHIAQIARVIARQSANDVGPWKTYIPLIQ